MKTVRKHLERLRAEKRKRYHPLIHKIHREHKISRRTLFYVKEYGPHSNVLKTIMKESIKILIFTSIISSIGGLALENIKTVFISVIPLIILLPVLNDTIGNYGTIFSSRFSTMLHEGRVRRKWRENTELKRMLVQVFIISILTAVISSIMALGLASLSDFSVGHMTALKVFTIALVDTVILVGILFLVSVLAGIYFYRKKEDPNNFLIPITTSIADFGNMIILSGLVLLFF